MIKKTEQENADYHYHRLQKSWIYFFTFLLITITVFAFFTRFDAKKYDGLMENPELLLSTMINIESISGNEEKMGEFLDELLKSNKWVVQRQYLNEKTFNVFAHKGNPNPRLIINSHMDTVPPAIKFSQDEKNLYGRGSSDAKGQITSQLYAVHQLLNENLISPFDIGFLYVVEEETTSAGMLKSNELGLTPEFLIVGEPTEGYLALGHKGSISLKILATGKASHSGYPELGVSAISPMLDILKELEVNKWPYDDYFGQTTLNVGVIQGGVAANVVPDSCNASVMIRSTVESSIIINKVLEIVDNRAQVQVVSMKDPFKCDVVGGFEAKMFSYGTDLPSFKGNHKSYLFGTGSILVAHTDGEYISKDDLNKGISEYKRLILTVLKQ